MAQPLTFATPAEAVADSLIVAGAATTFASPLLLVAELMEWLQTDLWPGWSVEDGLAYMGFGEPEAATAVMQFAVDLVTDAPLFAATFMIGVAIFFLGLNLTDPIRTR